ncbi:MAG: acetyl-CoA C-acyltransferase [Gemmatimonadaceae bacterium]
MTHHADAVIIDAARTPRGRGRPLGASRPGALAGVHPQELAAQVLQGLADRVGVPVHDVDDVVLGCVSQVDEQGANIARHAVLAAGWPDSVTGVTLTRACGSGLQALHYAAMSVMTGSQRVVVAGGVESMSRVPMGTDGASEARGAGGAGAPKGGGVGDGRNPRLRSRIRQVPQGISADLIATLEGFTREDVDAFALRSQQRAAAAMDACRFARSLIPVRDPDSGAVLLDREEFPRPTTAEGLAALPASFAELGALRVAGVGEGEPDETLDALALRQVKAKGLAPSAVTRVEHVHSAGSSSGIADGAAGVLVASAEYARAHGLRPRARIRAMATAGADPILMLTAPTPVSRKALAAAGMDARDVDLWEINEAFAAVPLKTIRDLGIDPERVNVNGGAIALGHPLGATGAILVGTALDELERRGLATALVTLCIAGGQGIAAILERI